MKIIIFQFYSQICVKNEQFSSFKHCKVHKNTKFAATNFQIVLVRIFDRFSISGSFAVGPSTKRPILQLSLYTLIPTKFLLALFYKFINTFPFVSYHWLQPLLFLLATGLVCNERCSAHMKGNGCVYGPKWIWQMSKKEKISKNL